MCELDVILNGFFNVWNLQDVAAVEEADVSMVQVGEQTGEEEDVEHGSDMVGATRRSHY